jgi:ubiquitin-like protein Pup
VAGQEQIRPGDRDGDPDDVPVPTAPQTQTKDEDVDAMLDEIDDVLESNAEEFVKGFVQKGGQ